MQEGSGRKSHAGGIMKEEQPSWETHRRHPGDTQETLRDTQKTPRGTQEAPRRPEGSRRQNVAKHIYVFCHKCTKQRKRMRGAKVTLVIPAACAQKSVSVNGRIALALEAGMWK